MASRPGRPPRADRRGRLRLLRHPPTWLKVALSVVVLGLLVWLVVLPDYRQASADLVTLEHLSFPLLVVALVLETASLIVFSGMTRTALRPTRVRFDTVLAIDLADLAANHVVPGGGTTSAAVRYALLTRVGVRRPDALAAAAIEVTISNLVLGLVFVVGLVFSVAQSGQTADDSVALVVAAGFAVLVTAAVWLLVRHGRSVARLSGRLARRLPGFRSRAAQLEEIVATFAQRVGALGREPGRVAVLGILGLGNWLFDAAALWVVLDAIGHPVRLGLLLTVYGVASLLAMLPLTPGGLGIVEGVMVPSLIVGGVPAPAALLGVVGWRVLSYWLPIPVGGIAAVWLWARRLPRRA